MPRLSPSVATVFVLLQSYGYGFNVVPPFDPTRRLLPSSSTAFGQPPSRPPPRPYPLAAVRRPRALKSSASLRNPGCACRSTSSLDGREHRRHPHLRCPKFDESVARGSQQRSLPSSSPSWSLSAGRADSSGTSTRASKSSPGDVEAPDEVDVGRAGVSGAVGGKGASGAVKTNKKGTRAKKEKSMLGKAGDALKTMFNAFMAASTLVSLALAVEAIWQLHGTQLTLSNAVPTLTKLIPLTGLGVFGAAQLVGLIARVVRVIVTLPIMLSGTWVLLQNAPKLLPQGSDLTRAGSLAAVLATPEVLEAAAVVALLGGTAIWSFNFATGAVGALLLQGKSREDEDGEDEDAL